MNDIPVNPYATGRIIAQWYQSRAFRGVRMAGAWERGLGGPAGEALVEMVVRHSAIRTDMLRCSLDLIADQAPRQRMVLADFAADIERLRAARTLSGTDARLMIRDLETSGRELAALERQAGARPTRLRNVVSPSVAAAARATLGPMTEAKLTEVVSEVSLVTDAEFHEALSRAFAAGPLGERECWARIAHVIERGFVPRKAGNLFNEVLGVTSELVGASQDGYRRIILSKSRDIVELGMEPVEIIGECWLMKADGSGLPLSFRDGLLLAVNTPSTPFKRIGEAGLVVAMESRQATTAAETGIKLLREESEFLQSRKLAKTIGQQFRAPERAREAIEAGDLLLTPDGSLYRLRPVPSALRRTVLIRPQILPAQELEQLLKATATVGEHPGDVIQVVSPFASKRLREHTGPMLRRLIKIFDQ
ncbi:hypothetical protein ABZ614_45485 [Streptomyces sp. NPDC013178]|uniref:hypothetical protein n=1 Tax=Streptomyces sp. NPDC013178 TaxID=3155118 RepID=UPI0033F3D30D